MSHTPQAMFETVIEALIFTVYVQGAVGALRRVLFWVGNWYSVGTWDDDAENVSLLVGGVAIGLAAAWLSHTDRLH